MKYVTALAVAALAATVDAVPVPYKECPGVTGVKILGMDANVWPPVSGSPLITHTDLMINTGVTGGNVEMRTKHPFGTKVDNIPFNEYGNFPANGTTGPFTLVNEGETPAGIAGMKFATKTTGVDQNGTIVFCYITEFVAQ